jgi:hypothetical protein
MKYICDRCDLRAESSLGHHVCEAPTDASLIVSLRAVMRPGQCVASLDYAEFYLGRNAQRRGYRWSLSSVGDGTEFRATFEHGLGNTIASVLDTTPARAFARGFLRLPKESEG